MRKLKSRTSQPSRAVSWCSAVRAEAEPITSNIHKVKITNFQKISSIMAGKSSRAVDDDLANVEFETSEDVEVIPTFDSMGLREDLLR